MLGEAAPLCKAGPVTTPSTWESDLVEPAPVYDSSRRAGPLAGARQAWAFRGLVFLLSRRELISRFQHSVLGAGWLLVTPLVYAAVLWVLFSHAARFSVAGVPYSVYVLSGTVILWFVSDGVMRIATGVIRNTVALRRIYIPAGVFAAAGALAAAAGLALTTAVLFVVQLITGAGVPLSAVLLPVLAGLLLITVGGAGLLVGALATLLSDALEAVRVLLLLAAFATPVFYPVEIIPRGYRFMVDINPLYHYLVVFRDLAYGGHAPPWASIAVCVGCSALFGAAGIATFARVQRTVARVL